MDKAIITIDIPKSREHEKEVIIQELAMKLLSQCEHGDTLIKAISDHNNEFDGREAPICEAESIIENQMYDLLTNPVKDMKTRMFKLLGLDKFLDKNPADPKYAYLYKSLDGTDEDEPVLSQDTYKEYFKVKYKFNLDQLVTYEAAKKMDEILSKMSPEYFKDKVNVVSKDLGEFRLGRWVEEEKTMYIKPDIFNQEWILSPESKVNLGQKVLAHELGHKIDHEYDYSKNDKWREISGWTKQESKDKIRSHYNMNGLWKVGKWYHDKTAAFINEYASRNPKEDFSESFAYAVIGLDQWFEVKECEDKKEFLKQYVLPDDIVLPNIKEQTQPGDVEMAKAVAEDKHYIMLEKSVQDYVGQNMVFRDGNNIVVAVKKIKAINDASDMFGPGTYNVETEAHGILGAMTAETIASLIDTVEPVEKSLGEQRPGHKYIRREGPAGGPYKYIYHDAQNKEYETEMQPSPKQILNHAKEKFEKNGMSTEIISINSDKAKELMRKMVGSKKLIGTQSNMQQIIQDTKEGKVYLIKENMRHPVSDKTVHHEHGHKVLWDTQNEIYKEYLNAAQNTKYYAEPDIITRDKMPIEAFAQEWAIYKTKPNILKHSSPEIFKVMQKAEKLYNNNEPSGYTEFENTKIGDLESIGNRRGLSASMSPNFNRQKNAIYEQLKAKGYTPNQISNMTVSEAKSELQKENKNQYELPSKQIEILASTGIRVDSPEEFKRNPGIKARIETAMDVMGTKEINEKMKLTIKPNNLANMGKNVKGRYFKQLTTIEVSPKHGESFIHEYGHFIDHAMGKKKGEKGYLTDSGIAWGAAKKGETYNNFDEAVDKTGLSDRIKNEVIIYHPKKEQFDALRYYNNSAEVFARTFEQYIAYKIGNQESKDNSVDPETGLRPRKYIAFAQLGNDYKTLCKKPHYFTDKEFQTIAPKFEAVLKKYLGNELLKAIMDDLEKALGQERAGHKYIRRIQNPRTGGWTYIYEEGQQRQPGTQPQEAPVTAQAEQNEGDYKYTYYHATPKAKAIHKKGFKDDTYVWVTKKQAEDYVKTQQEPGEKWEVVTVKSKEKLKADDPNITDEDKMDHGEYWMLKKENIKPEHPEAKGQGKTKPDGQVQKKETYVYHTTSPKNIESIAKHGMKPAIGMYGKGVYFAPSMEETGGYGSPEGAMIRMHRNNLPKDWNELEEQGFTEKPITADKLEVSLDKGKTWKPLNPSHPESKGQGKTETEPAQPKESKPVKEKKPKSEPKYLAKWVDKKSGKTLYLYPWSKPKEMNWKGYEDIIDDIMTNGGLKPYEKHSGILGMKVTKGDLWEEIKGAVPLWMMRKGGGTLDTHAQRHKMSESELLDRIVTARDSRIEAMNKLVADYQSRVEILGEGIAHVKTSEVEEATKESEIQEKEAGLENMPEATAESVVTELDSAAAEQERKMQEYADSMDQMEDTMNEYMLKQRAEETH